MMRALLVVMTAILAQPAAAQTLPAYKVVAEEKTDSARTVDVRLERRLDEVDVNAIASAIVSRETRPFTRTIVNFQLPSARPGEAPWASATLLREIRVKIPGLRLDEEILFTEEARADRRVVIGAWLTSTPATPGRLTIYRDGKRLIAEWRMRSGVRTQDEVAETRVGGGRRFDLKSGGNDDHFLMLAGGELEIRAKGALIAIAERIKEGPAKMPAVAAARERNTEVGRWPPVAAGAQAGDLAQATTEPPAKLQAPATVVAALPNEAAQRAAKPSVAPRQLAARKPAQQQATSPKIDLSKFLQPNT